MVGKGADRPSVYDFLPAPKQDNVINIVNVVRLAHRHRSGGGRFCRHLGECHKVTLLEGQIESSPFITDSVAHF